MCNAITCNTATITCNVLLLYAELRLDFVFPGEVSSRSGGGGGPPQPPGIIYTIHRL